MTKEDLEKQLERYKKLVKEQFEKKRHGHYIYWVRHATPGEVEEYYRINTIVDCRPDDEDYEPEKWSHRVSSLDDLAGTMYIGLRDDPSPSKIVVYASLTDDIDNAPRLIAMKNEVWVEDSNFPANKMLLDLQNLIMRYFEKDKFPGDKDA